MSGFDNIKPYHKDILREVGSICGGSSATSLFALINEYVTIGDCEVYQNGYRQLCRMLDNTQEIIVSQVGYDICGLLGLHMTSPSAYELITLLCNTDAFNLKVDDCDGLIDSAKIEVSSILFGNFLTSLSGLLPSDKSKITISTPVIIRDHDSQHRQDIGEWKHRYHVYSQIGIDSDSFKGSLFFFQDYLSFDFLLKGLSHMDNGLLAVLERY